MAKDAVIPDRVKGMLIGFAVGDALGAPAAGIRASQFLASKGQIDGFTSNPNHPILGNLKAGQYTENTRLLLDAMRDTIVADGFDPGRRKRSLIEWALRIRKNPSEARWPGPTTLGASSAFGPHGELTARKSRSVGACYRVLPLAILSGEKKVLDAAVEEAGLTHDSTEAEAAAGIVGLALFHSVRGHSLLQAVSRSIEMVQIRLGDCSVTKRCKEAISYQIGDWHSARRRFGTGARASESLPLAICIALQSFGNFSQAVVAGANSLRSDWVEPLHECLTLKEEIEVVNGGNTDGISALAGSLVGSTVGLQGINQQWRTVEDFEMITQIAEELIETLNVAC